MNKKSKQAGQAMITMVIFFLFISLAIIASMANSAIGNSKIVADLLNSKKSYFLAEASSEDVVYRIIRGKNYSPQEIVVIDDFAATSIISTIDDNKEIISSADILKNIRKVKALLSPGNNNASFHYGVQIGNGGLAMENTSSVLGNVYSNGPVLGENRNIIKGDVVSASSTGSINNIRATSSAYSHDITNSTIDKDVHYQTISNTIVGGISYPESPDQPLQNLPISDEQINEWEQSATSTIFSSPCPYIINDDTTIGPVKINCDLKIKGSPIITLNGPIWVSGNITIENTAEIRIAPSVGGKSLAVIADNPSNRLTSSKVDLQNNSTFYGSGFAGSYILFISQNNSAESGGSEKAISASNSANGAILFFAGHGEILLKNSVSLKEVTGYKVRLQNSAEVIYESGLASLLFESGPSGSFSIGNWRELK